EAVVDVVRGASGGSDVLALLRRACAAFPESARLAHALGQALHDAGESEESNAHFTRALALRHLAVLYQREGFKEDGTIHYWQFADHIRRALGLEEPEGKDGLVPG